MQTNKNLIDIRSKKSHYRIRVMKNYNAKRLLKRTCLRLITAYHHNPSQKSLIVKDYANNITII